MGDPQVYSVLPSLGPLLFETQINLVSSHSPLPIYGPDTQKGHWAAYQLCPIATREAQLSGLWTLSEALDHLPYTKDILLDLR